MNKLLLRLKNLSLTFLALNYCFFSGFRNKKIENPKKIILVSTGKLGDTVCMTPILYHLKNSIPGIEVGVVSSKVNLEVLKHTDLVDNYFEIKSVLKTASLIKDYDPDIILLPFADLDGLLISVFSGVKSIISNKPVGGRSIAPRTFYLLLNFVISIPIKMGEYMPGAYLRLLNPLGIYEIDTRKYLGFSKESKDKMKEILNTDKKLCGISIRAGNKIKEWPIENFASLVNQMSEKYNFQFVFFGSKEDRALNELFVSDLNPNVSFINLVGELNIDELKASISLLNLYIAVDTGPIYIAETFDIPTIDIVGAMDENEQPPTGRCFRKVYLKDRKEPAIHIMNARNYDEREARRQIEEITPEMVLNEVQFLIDNNCC